MRRFDTGWRDGIIPVRHRFYGFEAPAAGMKLPMIEYDRGEPLAVINYLNRADGLPRGEDVNAAYGAFGRLSDITGVQLPFMTAVYDPRTWAFQVYPHNSAAYSFLDVTPEPGKAVMYMTERQFVANLYRLRGRHVPDLEPFGVTFADEPWPDIKPGATRDIEQWPGQLMSQRRRNYEPAAQVRMGWRNPTLDIDFAVIDRNNRVALVVDYKAPGARIGLGSTNCKALASLYTPCIGGHLEVPAYVVQYAPVKPAWTFRVHCLNKSARSHLAYVLGGISRNTDRDIAALAVTIAGAEWVDLDEKQWWVVLEAARDQ